MNQDCVVSMPDDKTLQEDQIVSMLKYTAIYDALHNEEISVHEALRNASEKKSIPPQGRNTASR